jgi:hypothetical protein
MITGEKSPLHGVDAGGFATKAYEVLDTQLLLTCRRREQDPALQRQIGCLLAPLDRPSYR